MAVLQSGMHRAIGKPFCILSAAILRGKDTMISTPDTRVKVFVIPNKEEPVPARDTRDVVGWLQAFSQRPCCLVQPLPLFLTKKTENCQLPFLAFFGLYAILGAKGGKCMISENLSFLRKQANLSQEALAEKIGVSRQTIAKWENGESAPDILNCDRLAELYEISLDDLLHTELRDTGLPPRGKFIFGTVTIGDKGQIVIPVKARKTFHLKPGDDLLVLGDIKQGLALVRADLFLEVAHQIQEAGK